ncbi:MAG: hypothetical protein JW929_03030 [Anaerolineales bacterium]|nr:hypothetical protein [Anaerolineales bacterium]
MFSKKSVFAVGLMLFAASMACSNPITDYLSTQTAVKQTATATMWTPTPTDTPTPTPTDTPTPTPTDTPTPTPDPRYQETYGLFDFSYVPPRGWKKNSGEDLMAWEGPGNTALYFYTNRVNASANEIVDVLVVLYYEEYGFECESQGDFEINSGLDGAWMTCDLPNNTLVQEYIVSEKGKYVDAVYLREDGEDEDQDPVVEDCIRSIEFD